MATSLAAWLVTQMAWRYHDAIGPRIITDDNAIGVRHDFDSDAEYVHADELLRQRLRVAEGSPVTISFSGGENNVFGESLTLERVKALSIVNHGTHRLNVLEVGGSTRSLGFLPNPTSAVLVYPQGGITITAPTADGWPIILGDSDELLLTSQAGTIEVDIAVIGVYGGGGVIPETVFANELGEMLVNEIGDELEVGV